MNKPDKADSVGRKPGVFSSLTNTASATKQPIKPSVPKATPHHKTTRSVRETTGSGSKPISSTVPVSVVAPPEEALLSDSKRLGLTVSKKSYTELKKKEEELDRENSQLKAANSRLTHKVQAQEKKFKQLLEEKDKEIQQLLARVAEIEQEREVEKGNFQKLTEKHNNTSNHLLKCQTKLEILNINPVSLETLRDHEQINSEMNEYSVKLDAIQESLDADKQSLSTAISTASSILISLGLLEEQPQNIDEDLDNLDQ